MRPHAGVAVEIVHPRRVPGFKPCEEARIIRRADRGGDADLVESEPTRLGLEPIRQVVGRQ